MYNVFFSLTYENTFTDNIGGSHAPPGAPSVRHWRLQNQGKSLADFSGMPIPIHTKSPNEEALIIQRELDYNVDVQLVIVVHDVPSLNYDQLSVLPL